MARRPAKPRRKARNPPKPGVIAIRGARQNNLRNLDLDLPLGEFVVVTGVSGSGKSSLAFDTVYAEGQRRYVETFSPYARQFLDRMDKPLVDRIDGIPPAIAIDQTNPVRTSRSTVGTMTELADYLKLLYARAARLYCRRCGGPVERDNPDSILKRLVQDLAGGTRLLITFPLHVPENFSGDEIRGLLARQGYTRIHRQEGDTLEIVQDRVRLEDASRGRILEALEKALDVGRGSLRVYPMRGDAPQEPLSFSSGRHCASCDIAYHDTVPGTFSFNSPIGACETCRGFGRIMGIDYGLVIPDVSRSLADGAIKPFQSKSYSECQADLMRFARRKGIPTTMPWSDLSEIQRQWVIEGEGRMADRKWYGVSRFFKWLEGRAYKMHVRVLLSRYRSYSQCTDCRGARLKPESLLWRLGTRDDAGAVMAPGERFRPTGMDCPDKILRDLPGLCIHDVMLLPIDKCQQFLAGLRIPPPLNEATDLVLREIRSRMGYLVTVGLGYLNLDRQSRTLSGGEVQRINLTTALGTSLVNTLFVLDEPSVGLHARDIGRVAGILQRLRDAGNSLLVVEHDGQLMGAADRILDMGPGPGEAGGNIVCFGTPGEVAASPASLTGAYLRGERLVNRDRSGRGRPPEPDSFWLEVRGARAHNLKNIHVRIPLQRLVCITGVSGSGKSTLVENVLYPALLKIKGEPADAPGAHDEITGHEYVNEITLVDQSPLGRTTRSNPASYIGVLTPIREAFAALPASQVRSYTAGTFSFNSGDGRCPGCGGNGFEHVEMQFLSDVYLRCPDCNGSRYRNEILEVRLPAANGAGAGKSIADVLDMTVTEARGFFAAHPAIVASLGHLAAVGLDYLRLGQPVTTLSGGEAQRLKLAGQLARTHGARNLLLLDEPTTGLHFHDIAALLGALRALVAQGHSVVVVEHNLDLIWSSDWIIDLGPEAGDAGGQVMASGPPRQIAAVADSRTGQALREHQKRLSRGNRRASGSARVGGRKLSEGGDIRIRQAREHNLKGIDLALPRDRLSVITGVSGSGKSTLAFDVLFAEGQRRYLESLNAYARQFVQPARRPDVDSILGIPPTVAIEQRTSRGGQKSTVATLTEVYHFLRLLFARLGTQYCPDCDTRIVPQSPEAILAHVMRSMRGRQVQVLAPLVVARKGYYTELARWAARRGFDELRVDGEMTPTADWPRLDRFMEHDIELPIGQSVAEPRQEGRLRELLREGLELGKGSVLVTASRGKSPALYSIRRACPGCSRSFPELDPRLFSFNSRHGWCPACFGTGLELPGFDAAQSGEEAAWMQAGETPETCSACAGHRLRPEALAIRFRDQGIADLTALSVGQAMDFFASTRLSGREAAIARDMVREITSRLGFLRQVGLDYLSLGRSAVSLSGGEAQRIRLAAQLGSNLRGVCYILDEPTIGLHPRDNQRLLDTLMGLRDNGNTVLVVEHDEDTIRQADHVVDLGPGAGLHGGEVVASGTVRDLTGAPRSLTGKYLARREQPKIEARRNTPAEAQLRVDAATLHNLKSVSTGFPLERLTVVTGVSGSGKSSLVRQVLLPNLKRLLAHRPPVKGSGRGTGRSQGRSRRKSRTRGISWTGCRRLAGWEPVQRILEVDQAPIGKSPRSCPGTYTGIWDEVRRIFAQCREARIRGYSASRFSFNVGGGRCGSCEGQGLQRIEMSFLPDVSVLCEACGGDRFNSETLEVRYRGHNIRDVLNLSISAAVELFAAHPRLHQTLQLLDEVGLGYLTLGQQSPTLSGGEAQRLKLVTELARARPGTRHALYILDEPTVGLHMADVEKLLAVLRRLVDSGNTVIVIEHNLDVIARADWVIDMGPEGGDGGGQVVASCAPADLARNKNSYTGLALATHWRGHG